MTQQTRIGLLAFAGVGGIFIVIVVGVVIVAASQSKPSRPTEPAAIAKASPKSAATRQRVEPRPVVSPPSPSSVIKPIVEAAKSIARNPKEWDFKDLADHLKRHGFPEMEVLALGSDSRWMLLDGQVYKSMVGWLSHRDSHFAAMEAGAVKVQDNGPDFDAAKTNRNLPDDERDGTWSWGRFTFRTYPKHISRLRKLFGN